MKRWVIFAHPQSSYWMWRGDPRLVAKFINQSHWSGLDQMAWAAARLVEQERTRLLLLPLASYSPEVAQALSRVSVSTQLEFDLSVLKVARADAGAMEPGELAGWDKLSIPIAPALSDLQTTESLVWELLSTPHAAAEQSSEAAVPPGLIEELASMATALGTDAPAEVPDRAAVVTSDEEMKRLPLPRRGSSVALSKANLERQASELGLTLDWPAYIRAHAEELYAQLPHPSWASELADHAPSRETPLANGDLLEEDED